MKPRTVYLTPETEQQVEDLARRVDVPRGALLRRLVLKGLQAVDGDPVRLLLKEPNPEGRT